MSNCIKYPQQKLKQEWIQNGINDCAIEWAKSFGEYLTSQSDNLKGLTTSQIRKFFGELKRIQADPIKYSADIPMLKAKLAYAVGRDKDNRGNSKSKIVRFYEELENGINWIRESSKIDDFNRLIKIIESIVAYHKFYGGRDN
jgi:CRISPR-associated protein Csm2